LAVPVGSDSDSRCANDKTKSLLAVYMLAWRPGGRKLTYGASFVFAIRYDASISPYSKMIIKNHKKVNTIEDRIRFIIVVEVVRLGIFLAYMLAYSL
jgi:hypothetical protein